VRASIAAILAAVGCSSSSTPPRAPEQMPLELRIRLDRSGTEQVPARYAAGDPVRLHVELVNRCDAGVDVIAPVLRLTNGDPWCTLAPIVKSGADTPMLAPDPRVSHVIWNVVAPPPATIALAPGEVWRGELPLYSDAWSWMYGRESTAHPGNYEPGSHDESTLLPGHYAVAVEYTTRWTEDFLESSGQWPGLVEWQAVVDRAWHGSIVSNNVTLDIAP
jgi:hypothetical protein